jgi:DNA-binding transcriptional MerR regulator
VDSPPGQSPIDGPARQQNSQRRRVVRSLLRTAGLLHEPDRTLGGHRAYPPATVTVLRVINAAQRLGFTLDEAADLLEVSRLRAGQRTDAGLQARARVKLDEVDAKLVELTTVRDTLRAALDAGCDDLIACGDSPCCPLPFVVSVDSQGNSGLRNIAPRN